MRVHCYLTTKNLFCSLLCFGLLSLQGIAFAQVYKSYDADGNVVFSDKPTQRSKEVEITKPNLSNSFEIPPSPPAEPPLETKPESESEPEPVTQPIADDALSADTNNDGRVSRREKEEQRKERRKKKREKAKAAEGNKE